MERDAKVAWKLKSSNENNFMVRWAFNRVSDYFIKKAEEYARMMKEGGPPRLPKDYSKIPEDYSVPNVLCG